MSEFVDSSELQSAYRQCESSTRRHAKSFYFASKVLPVDKRMAAYAIYAFCRHADNIIDESRPMESSHDTKGRIEAVREELRCLYAAQGQGSVEFLALQETVRKYRIPLEYFVDLLRGVEMDLEKTRYGSFHELQEYCYRVASVVGLMMARVFGYADERALRHAEDLGTAMQLTNILRDIEEDYRRGRIYLPADEMERFGVTEHHIAEGVLDMKMREFMAFQTARAYDFYRKADPGIPLLTDDGSRFCVRLMSNTYRGILDDILAHGYAVFGYRAHVPLWKKFATAGIAAYSRKTKGTPDVSPPDAGAVVHHDGRSTY